MASESEQQSEDISRIRSEGFVKAEDLATGQEVEKLRNEGFQLKTTAKGLRFCRQWILENERVQHVLNTFYKSPCLGVYHWYSCDPSQTYQFLKNDSFDPPAIAVHLFTPGTRLIIFKGSQQKVFKTWHAPNGMLVVLNAALRKANKEEIEVTLEHGGLIIADGRLCFRGLQGHAIIAIFTDKGGEELKKWDMMEVAQGLEQEVTEMKRSGIATTFINCPDKLTVS